MTTELTLAVPSFADLPPEEVTAFAEENTKLMKAEAAEAKRLALQAAKRMWLVGKACVYIKDNKLVQPDLFEEWATSNVGGGDYHGVYRSMRFYRMSEDGPPGRVAAQFKQLLIMNGDEPMPKLTPRKTDGHRFLNFKAACSSIQRFWRGGDAIQGLDAETLKEIADDLAPIVEIAAAVNVALTLEGGE
jgi:hypothetical protein